MNGVLEYYVQWLEYRRWYLRIPGVQVALREHGELRLSTALGVSDEGTGAALTPEHLFRVASHSKTFTAVTLLQLVEAGRLRLDDPLGAHLPELAGTELGRRSLAELLAHGGGVIRDSEDGDFWQLMHPFPDRAQLLDIARLPSAATLARNEHFKYSNIGYGLLGLVIEAVTGEPFADRLRTAIIEPLGLADTGAEYDPARAAEYAGGHTGLGAARERRGLAHVDTRALAAATGVYATARDLTAFYSALLPGSETLLGPDALRRLTHPQWEIKRGQRHYGLGVFLDRVADVALFGHTGGYPGHITCSYADPDSGWVLSVLTNAIDGAASALAAGLLHLRRLGAGGSHPPSPPEAARLTGRFASMWGVLDVARLDDRLYAITPTAPEPAEDAVPLEYLDGQTLKIVGGRGGNSYGELMRYQFGPDGEVASLRADSGSTMTPLRLP